MIFRERISDDRKTAFNRWTFVPEDGGNYFEASRMLFAWVIKIGQIKTVGYLQKAGDCAKIGQSHVY